MKSFEQELLLKALDKGYVVFAPKGPQDLRVQYPELGKFEEFKDRGKITATDLLFIWYYCCTCSPFSEMPDMEKLPMCIDAAYPSETLRAERRERWKNLKFNMAFKNAMDRMASINCSARIRSYQASLQTMNACLEVIAEKLPADPEERSNYMTRIGKAQELLDRVTEKLEKGSYGVEELSNTVLDALKGVHANYRVTRTR